MDLLMTRVVPFALLSRIMSTDSGTVMEVEGPVAPPELESWRADLGEELPDAYVEWVRHYGAGAVDNEGGFVLGLSVSSWKDARHHRDGREEGIVVATFDEGDDVRYLVPGAGAVASTAYDDWYPTFTSFVAAVLLGRSSALLAQFSSEIEAIPETEVVPAG